MPKYALIDTTNLGPLTKLKIAKPGGDETEFATPSGFLDTGSPCTYIPKEVIEDLGLSPIGRARVTTVAGEARCVHVYAVDITMVGPEFHRRAFTGWRVLSTGLDKAVIGRDILQHFVMIFDGPAQEWRVG